MALATAVIASSCPITRSCSRSSIFISFSISPSTSRLTGMPVQRETISAMSSPSTSSLSSAPSCCRRFLLLRLPQLLLQLDQRAVLQLGRAVQVVGALACSISTFGLVDLLAQVGDRSAASRARPPSGERSASRFSLRSASSFSRFFESLSRRGVFLLAQRLALDLELHDAALGLVQLDRHRGHLHAQLATPPRRRGRSPCRAGSGR